MMMIVMVMMMVIVVMMMVMLAGVVMMAVVMMIVQSGQNVGLANSSRSIDQQVDLSLGLLALRSTSGSLFCPHLSECWAC